jgi:hypothetical protein
MTRDGKPWLISGLVVRKRSDVIRTLYAAAGQITMAKRLILGCFAAALYE